MPMPATPAAIDFLRNISLRRLLIRHAFTPSADIAASMMSAISIEIFSLIRFITVSILPLRHDTPRRFHCRPPRFRLRRIFSPLPPPRRLLPPPISSLISSPPSYYAISSPPSSFRLPPSISLFRRRFRRLSSRHEFSRHASAVAAIFSKSQQRGYFQLRQR